MIIILTDAGTAGRYWCEIWLKMHWNCEFEFLLVEYQRCDYYEEIVHYYTRNSSMYSILCHWGVMFSVLSAGIYLVEWIRKNSSWRRAQFSSAHYRVLRYEMYSVIWTSTHVMHYQQVHYWYSHDELSDRQIERFW